MLIFLRLAHHSKSILEDLSMFLETAQKEV